MAREEAEFDTEAGEGSSLMQSFKELRRVIKKKFNKGFSFYFLKSNFSLFKYISAS